MVLLLHLTHLLQELESLNKTSHVSDYRWRKAQTYPKSDHVSFDLYNTVVMSAWWKHSPRSSFRHFISSSMFFAETDGDHEIIRWWLMTEFTHEHTTLHYCSPTAHYNTLHNPTAHYSKIQKVSFVRFAFSKWSFFIEVAVLCGHVISLKSSKLWPRHKADFNRTVTLQSLRCRAPPPTESHQS